MAPSRRSIVITGAGSGVGRATALAFAEQGDAVVCADVNAEWADATAAAIGDKGGEAIAVACDVTNEDDVAGALDRAIEAFDGLDVVVNNAGVATPRPGLAFEDHTIEDWERLVAINLRGVFLGCKHAVIRFKRQGTGGIIVNTGSAAGLVGWGGSVYGTTKGGVIQMTRALAVEAAPHDIRVNCICPGAMPTTNFSRGDATPAFAPTPMALVDQVGAMHPLGRPIDPEDCAAAITFLASPAARNITGIALPIDGGFTAR